jgi:UDP-glucose 4-epimerase
LKVLVTGGCGYIGSHVIRQLSDSGHSVVVVDDLSAGFADALLNGEELYVGNFGDPLLLTKIFEKHSIDAVMHFAANLVVPESVENPLKYYRNNTGNTIELLDACVRAGVRYFILSSTGATYGDPQSEKVKETDPTNPQSPYAMTKLMDEIILKDTAAAHALKYVVLRYFNVAGADPELRVGQRTKGATHLIKVACEAALGTRTGITVTGTDYDTPDGTGVRDYIHVEDLAAAHLCALDYLNGGGSSDLFNCGYGHGFSVREVLKAVAEASGEKVPSQDGPRRAGDVARVISDSSKLRKTLNWKPRYDDLKVICQTALEFERKRMSLEPF